MGILVRSARLHRFVDTDEVEEAAEKTRRWTAILLMTVPGIAIIGLGGELVATGVEQIVVALGVPAALMGMAVASAAIELEEVVRQAVPIRAGHPELSAGNLVGTLLYFALFNLGPIALLTPLQVNARVRSIDWPVLLSVTLLAAYWLLDTLRRWLAAALSRSRPPATRHAPSAGPQDRRLGARGRRPLWLRPLAASQFATSRRCALEPARPLRAHLRLGS